MKHFNILRLLILAVIIFLANLRFNQLNKQKPIETPLAVSMTAPYISDTPLATFSGTSAKAACLIDAKSGAVLYSHNENIRLPMASTTKIMTALVVLENMSPDTVVTVPKEVVKIEGSSIYLAPDEKITVETLLYGLMLESGNDAAYTLAVACSGSIDEFCNLMNEKAKSLGLIDTHFTNPHGLHNDEHYTTAYELCVIAANALENETFRKITSTKSMYAKSTFSDAQRYFVNHNKLLRFYNGSIGVKTGFTKAAGRCLVTAAERDEERFVAVTLNDGNDWRDHTAMLDFGFENFDTLEIAAKDSFYIYGINGKKFVPSQNVFLTVTKGEKAYVDYKVAFSENGAQAEYFVDGKTCGKFLMKSV